MKNNIIIITAESNGEKQTKAIYVPLSYSFVSQSNFSF